MAKFEVFPTPVGDRQLRALRGETRRRAKQAMDDLERRGCEAAHWRLEGDEVERICVIDLGRDWRMLVAFPSPTEVVVLLVGRHLDRRPAIDVYRRLFDGIGIGLPTAVERQGHPPCCPTGDPPIDRAVVDRLLARAKELRRAGRGRRRGRNR